MHFAARLAAVLLFLLLAGCRSDHPGVVPLSHGYEEVTHSDRSMAGAAGGGRTAFVYHAPDGQTLPIWPSLYGVDEVIHTNLAVFVGDVTRGGRSSRSTGPRLFVVAAPELPVDITSAVVWRWSQASGKDFRTALEKFSLVTPVARDGRLELHFDFWTEEGETDWPDRAVLTLEWNQVTDILRAVKQRGGVKKDARWRTPFIGE